MNCRTIRGPLSGLRRQRLGILGRSIALGALLAAFGCRGTGAPHAERALPAPDGGTAVDILAGAESGFLENGLRYVLLPDPSAPIVATAVGYRVGAVHEKDGITGIAHFLEHMMFHGTDRYGRHDIDAITFRAAGSNNAFTTNDNTVYFFQVHRDHLDEVLALEANRMTRCTLDDSFDTEKENVREERRRDEDRPWFRESEERDRILFQRHPYRNPVLGRPEDVRKMTREQMKAFYREYYSPNNATLVVVGDFDPVETRRKISQLFGPLRPGTNAPDVKIEEPPQAEARRSEFRTNFEGDRLLISWKTVPIGTPDDAVLDVISAILTDSRSARLNQRLVEKEELASEGAVGSHHESRKYYGIFSVTVEPLPGADVERCRSAILEEIVRLAEEGPTEEELRKAKNITQVSFLSGLEGTLNLAVSIANLESIGAPGYLREYLGRVEDVTSERIREVARRYLLPELSTTVISRGQGQGGGGAPPPAKRHARLSGAGHELSGTRRAVLSNGLTLLVLRRARLPLVSITAHVETSHLYEPEDQAGLAHLTGILLDEGSWDPQRAGELIPYDRIAERIESLGATLSTGADGASLKGLSKHVDVLLDTLHLVLCRPAFPPDRLARCKTSQLDDIAHRKDDPETALVDLFRSWVFRGHPLGRVEIGTAETVEKLVRPHVERFYNRFFVPNNTTIAVVGDVDPDRLIRMVEERFGSWGKREGFSLPVLPPPPPREAKILWEKRDLQQSNLMLGNLGIDRKDPDFYAAKVAESIFCSSPVLSDRLSKEIRVTGGLAYSVYGTMTGDADVYPGAFLIYVGTRAETTAQALEKTRAVMREFVRNGPTAEEVRDAKNYLIKGFSRFAETSDQLAALLVRVQRLGLGLDYPETYRSKIAAVTADDVKRVAARLIDLENSTLAVVGPVEAR